MEASSVILEDDFARFENQLSALRTIRLADDSRRLATYLSRSNDIAAGMAAHKRSGK